MDNFNKMCQLRNKLNSTLLLYITPESIKPVQTAANKFLKLCQQAADPPSPPSSDSDDEEELNSLYYTFDNDDLTEIENKEDLILNSDDD